jgi:hypothetical protein
MKRDRNRSVTGTFKTLGTAREETDARPGPGISGARYGRRRVVVGLRWLAVRHLRLNGSVKNGATILRHHSYRARAICRAQDQSYASFTPYISLYYTAAEPRDFTRTLTMKE